MAPDTARNDPQDRIPTTAANALYDVLLPLCDDLPGEPPALLAWSPSRLAEVIAAGLAENGYAVTREALCARSGGCRG